MGNINDIVKVDIDIASPAVDSTSFDNLLIVGLAPYGETDTPPPDVGVYSSLAEVNNAGWISSGDGADPIGLAAMVAFSQNPQPSKVYIAVQKEEDVEGVGVTEHPVETLKRALAYNGWYVICPAGIPESQYEEIAQWTETQTKLFAFTYLDGTPPVGDVYFRSIGWYGKEAEDQLEEEIKQVNLYMHVAATAKCLSYESGSETWAFKQLASVYPADISSTAAKNLQDKNINYYISCASKNITQLGKVMAGEWIDVIRFRDWLQNDMQIRIFNLFLVNPKIPYTNNGISLVENQMIASLKSGIARGGIPEDEFDADDNLKSGFTVTVPNAVSLTDTEKASRILTGCKFTARIAGAIHVVEVRGNLVYS